MSSKTYDPETKKEYVHENEYDYRIQRFCELGQYVKHEEEVIDFAFSLRDKLINDLEDENDTIRLKYIKWIEDEYLLATKDFMIQHELNVPDNINNFKAFTYEHQIQGFDNKPIEKFITKSDKNTGGRPEEPDKKVKKKQLRSDYYDLTSNKGYKKSKALDILEENYAPWKRSTIETYLKK